MQLKRLFCASTTERRIIGTMRALLLIIFTMLGVVGCVPRSEEKITPAFPVERLDSQINSVAPLLFHIPIDPIQVDDEFQQVGNINNIGGAFRRFFEMIADVTIDRGEVGDIKLGPFDYTINELEEVDFDFVKDVVIKTVRLEIEEKDKLNDDVNFNFLKRLEIYVKFLDEHDQNRTGPAPDPTPAPTPGPDKRDKLETEPTVGTTGDGNTSDGTITGNGPSEEEFEGAYLVLSFDKDSQRLMCDSNEETVGKCLEMVVHRVNWKERLRKNRNFSLLVKLKAAEAPKKEFSFRGYVDVQVSINLGI